MKNASKVIALAMGLSTAALGCGAFVTETPLNVAPRPLTPRRPECVEVFSSSPPAQPHVDVALLDVNHRNGIEAPPSAVLIQRLRERGAEKGCDALFIGTGQAASAFGVFGAGAKRMQATCVVYNEPHACTVPLPVGPSRRTCRDRQDFEIHRNCILAI